ncbi:MAG: ATP-binding cassette domain-containing protein, partial [Pseudomonadota bacterium]
MENKRGDAPAIACKGVWQVFGEQPEKALQLALQDHPGDAFAAANQLRERGLIPAVQDATFEVHEGELFVIMGLSGSGKSTLIRCISHLL